MDLQTVEGEASPYCQEILGQEKFLKNGVKDLAKVLAEESWSHLGEEAPDFIKRHIAAFTHKEPESERLYIAYCKAVRKIEEKSRLRKIE